MRIPFFLVDHQIDGSLVIQKQSLSPASRSSQGTFRKAVRTVFQSGVAACSGEHVRRRSNEVGCAGPQPPPRCPAESSDWKFAGQLSTSPSATMGRDLAQIRFPLQGRELSSRGQCYKIST